MSTKVKTPKFRVAFPKVFKAESFQNGAPKYSIVMLFPKDSTDLSALKEAMKEARDKKWPDANKRPKGLRNPIRDGDEKTELQGYAGNWFVFASSPEDQKPQVVDQRLNVITEQSDFYGGCYARATLNAFAYDTAGNRGISFGLNNIQKLADGESFSGRTSAMDDFDAVDEDFNSSKSDSVVAEDDDFLN